MLWEMLLIEGTVGGMVDEGKGVEGVVFWNEGNYGMCD